MFYKNNEFYGQYIGQLRSSIFTCLIIAALDITDNKAMPSVCMASFIISLLPNLYRNFYPLTYQDRKKEHGEVMGILTGVLFTGVSQHFSRSSMGRMGSGFFGIGLSIGSLLFEAVALRGFPCKEDPLSENQNKLRMKKDQ